MALWWLLGDVMHHIVTTLCMTESWGRVCSGPNCGPDSWLVTAYPPKRWHLLRMEGSFDLRRRGSVVLTRYINELIYRIRERSRRRTERRIETVSPYLPPHCAAMVSSYLAPARS
jgi:hypothetical protein